MPRVKEIADKFFNRDDAGQTLTEFVGALTASETRNSSVGIQLSTPQDFTVNGQDVYRFLSDRGAGRVYDGLKSLELMSRTISGIGVSTAALFDNVIIAFTATDMQGASDDQAAKIVSANIGILDVYNYAKSVNSLQVAQYDLFVASVARQVRAGGFKTDDHLDEALIRVKALIRSVLNK